MKPIEIFISYSHQDEALMQELVKHLSILQHQGIIRTWHKQEITAGSERAEQIDRHLESAGIILLLISSDFLASDYRYSVELARAMERHKAREACVIPVILRPVDWKDSPFSKLQALPANRLPITKWEDQDDGFLNVVEGFGKRSHFHHTTLRRSFKLCAKRSVATSKNAAARCECWTWSNRSRSIRFIPL